MLAANHRMNFTAPRDGELNIQLRAKFGHESFVAIARLTAKLVIEMNCVELEIRPAMNKKQQRGAVRPTADADGPAAGRDPGDFGLQDGIAHAVSINDTDTRI